jgi:hypothetical protein
MNTGKRNLIIVSAFIIVLGGTTAALMLTGNGKDTAGSSVSSPDSIQLVSKKEEDIVSMSVKNKNGSYTLIPIKTPLVGAASTASTSSQDLITTYTVKGLEDLDIDKAATDQVVQNGYSLSATKNLGAVTNLEEYGLKDPQAVVEVSFRDGSHYNYKIGSPSATDNTSYYMCGENSNNVYLVGVDSGILDSEKHFINKNVLAITNTGKDNEYTKIKLSGKNFPQPVAVEMVDNVMTMTSPIHSSIDDNKLAGVQNSLTTLIADSVEAVHPDAAAIKKYGLDVPTAVAEFTANKENYKIMVGAKNGNQYYAALDPTKAIYLVKESDVSAWAEISDFTLRSKLLILPTIDSLKSIAVEKGNASSAVTVERTKDEQKSTQDKPAYTYKVLSQDGKELQYDTSYKSFFISLISLETLEGATQKPSGSPTYRVTYSYFDKGSTDTVEFYKSSDRRYTAVVNGEIFGTIVSTDVDKVFEKFDLLQAGKTVATD